MYRRIRILIALVFVLSLANMALAQELPPQPQHSDPTWQASYWNNMTLSGTPVLQRSEANLDYDWGSGSPDPGVNSDNFSARWTGYIVASSSDTYRFTATSDDGMRVWVDNDLIINEWYDHPPKTVSADKSLSAGHHWVVVEFYENGGAALARLSWAPASSAVTNWQGEYFNNTTLSGSPALVRDDAQIDFDWGAGSPAPGTISADTFSVRWTRTVNLPAGYYRFTMTIDDGGRLWVNNQLLIDRWHDQAAQTHTGDIYLSGGEIPIKMEYYEHQWMAMAKLSWAPTSSPTANWRGEYFNNTTLSGSPALVRDDAQIDFDWGAGSPAPGTISADTFSVRWTQTVNLPAGYYRFTMTIDDGGRLWVNNQLLIDRWHDQAAQTHTGDIYLPGGEIPIKMEYYEHQWMAMAKLSWAPTSSPTANWRGEYFNNTTLSGSPALVRDDAQIDFDWGYGSPAPGTIGSDRFSVRWTCSINLSLSGTYRFTATSDDGMRVWVDNALIINEWYDHSPKTVSADKSLSAGHHGVVVEFYEKRGAAVAKLSWAETGPSPPPPPPPSGTVIVDDTDPGFVKGGLSSGWYTASEGYGDDLTWTHNNDRIRSGYNWARWYPYLNVGRYEVFVFIPYQYSTTSRARYWIAHAKGYTLRIVNQSTNQNCWVSLGTYWFNGGNDEYISLADVTYEPRRARMIAFDAAKWEPR